MLSESEDETERVWKEWIDARSEFADISTTIRKETKIKDECENRPHCWSVNRLNSIAAARQDSLDIALQSDSYDYYFTVDADVFLTEKQTLRDLVQSKCTVISPMLHVHENAYGSNFWADVDVNGFYRRGHSYLPILRYGRIDIHRDVKAVHSAVLIDLHSEKVRKFLRYQDASISTNDDVVTFSKLAREHSIEQCVTNKRFYGVMMDSMNSEFTFLDEKASFERLRNEYLVETFVSSAYLLYEIIPRIYGMAEQKGAIGLYSSYNPAFTASDTTWTRAMHTDAYEQLCTMTTTRQQKEQQILRLHWNPQILRFRDFVTQKEADELIEIATSQLAPSVAYDSYTGKYKIVSYRTSQIAWLDKKDHSVVRSVLDRVSSLTGLDTTHAERLQIQRYAQHGGRYEPHFDYARLDKNLKERGGNRIATLLIYLNDDFEGGATVFTRLGLRVEPRRGDAIFWYNLLPAGIGDFRTKHGGCPAHGSVFKWIANLWIREDGNRHVYDRWGGLIGRTSDKL